jgi:hypothetical protein
MKRTVKSSNSPSGRNRFGLGRTIGEAVRREVRRRCGFGCVICGNAIVTYEHFSPPYKDARMHDPNGITLLCGGHQLESSKGLLSKETIAEANANPICKRRGHAKHMFDLGGAKPTLLLGGADVTQCAPAIEIDGAFFFKIDPPDRRSSRWRLSCRFCDETGKLICEILENELIIQADNVDIEQSATRLLIRSDANTLLELEVQPPAGFLLKQYSLQTTNGRLYIGGESHSNGPPVVPASTVLRLETANGGAFSLRDCTFISPGGLRINFCGSGIQLAPM